MGFLCYDCFIMPKEAMVPYEGEREEVSGVFALPPKREAGNADVTLGSSESGAEPYWRRNRKRSAEDRGYWNEDVIDTEGVEVRGEGLPGRTAEEKQSDAAMVEEIKKKIDDKKPPKKSSEKDGMILTAAGFTGSVIGKSAAFSFGLIKHLLKGWYSYATNPGKIFGGFKHFGGAGSSGEKKKK